MRFQACFFVALFAVVFDISTDGDARAAIISQVGSVEGAQASDWRSTGTPKTLDIDGSNAYGSSLGALNFGGGVPGITGAGSPTFGWAFISSGSQFTNPGYASIDDTALAIGGAVANTSAGIAHGGFTFELTGVAADYAGKTVRVGVMADVLTAPEWPNDVFKGLQLIQTVGGVGDSGVVSLRGGGAGNGIPEMYFFDITGVSAGNRFAILAFKDVGGLTPGGSGAGQDAYLSAVSWDIATVPEPSSLALTFLGLSLLIAKRRSRIFRLKSADSASSPELAL